MCHANKVVRAPKTIGEVPALGDILHEALHKVYYLRLADGRPRCVAFAAASGFLYSTMLISKKMNSSLATAATFRLLAAANRNLSCCDPPSVLVCVRQAPGNTSATEMAWLYKVGGVMVPQTRLAESKK